MATTKVTLTKQEIIDQFVTPGLVCLRYGLSFIENQDEVADVIATVKDAVDNLEAGAEPDLNATIEAGFDIATNAAALTPTTIDDKIVAAGKTLYDAIHGNGNIFKVLFSFLSARKAAKAAASQTTK